MRTVVSSQEDYDKTARALLTKKRFDPDIINKDKTTWTPVTTFCFRGNLKRTKDSEDDFPTLMTAAGGHWEICQLLF